MVKIIVVKGLPASGKSTWSRKQCLKDSNFIRINKDDIRKMLGKCKEALITDICLSSCIAAIRRNYSVILDNTNLDNRSLSYFLKEIKKKVNFKIEFKDLTHVSLQTCIERDANRPKGEQVGTEVILKFHKKYLE
jgi:predicted kinase